MPKKIEIHKQQIELAAEKLARILIQQVISKKNLPVNIQIETEYGKSNE